jgi:hypothetical protein
LKPDLLRRRAEASAERPMATGHRSGRRLNDNHQFLYRALDELGRAQTCDNGISAARELWLSPADSRRQGFEQRESALGVTGVLRKSKTPTNRDFAISACAHRRKFTWKFDCCQCSRSAERDIQ